MPMTETRPDQHKKHRQFVFPVFCELTHCSNNDRNSYRRMFAGFLFFWGLYTCIVCTRERRRRQCWGKQQRRLGRKTSRDSSSSSGGNSNCYIQSFFVSLFVVVFWALDGLKKVFCLQSKATIAFSCCCFPHALIYQQHRSCCCASSFPCLLAGALLFWPLTHYFSVEKENKSAMTKQG